jgi:VanZ family protein
MTGRSAGSRWGRPVVLWWSRPATIAAALLLASVLPLSGGGGALPGLSLGTDTWLHVAGYAALSASLSRTLAVAERRLPTAVGLAAALAMGYGAGIELLQTAVPTRGLAWSDVAANGVGVTLGGPGGGAPGGVLPLRGVAMADE